MYHSTPCNADPPISSIHLISPLCYYLHASVHACMHAASFVFALLHLVYCKLLLLLSYIRSKLALVVHARCLLTSSYILHSATCDISSGPLKRVKLFGFSLWDENKPVDLVYIYLGGRLVVSYCSTVSHFLMTCSPRGRRPASEAVDVDQIVGSKQDNLFLLDYYRETELGIRRRRGWSLFIFKSLWMNPEKFKLARSLTISCPVVL